MITNKFSQHLNEDIIPFETNSILFYYAVDSIHHSELNLLKDLFPQEIKLKLSDNFVIIYINEK